MNRIKLERNVILDRIDWHLETIAQWAKLDPKSYLIGRGWFLGTKISVFYVKKIRGIGKGLNLKNLTL